jgi:hypothetical protein
VLRGITKTDGRDHEMILIGRALDLGLDEEGGKWVTVCFRHNAIHNHRTKERAIAATTERRKFMQGCEECEKHIFADLPVQHVHRYNFSRSCGANVCVDCGWHEGLARCFCGWASSGEDGYKELVDMGEQIEEDY